MARKTLFHRKDFTSGVLFATGDARTAAISARLS